MKRGSWIRNLIFWLVDNWLEGIVIMALIFIIYAIFQSGGEPIVLCLLLISLPTLVIIAWLLFNIIEVRETLRQIEENTRDGNNIEFNTTEPILASDEKYCPNCNAIIKKTAKKCRYCNTWLNNNGGNES